MAEAKLDDRGEGCGERPVCAGERRVRAGGLTARGPENPRHVGLAIPEDALPKENAHTRTMTARQVHRSKEPARSAPVAAYIRPASSPCSFENLRRRRGNASMAWEANFGAGAHIS